MKRVHHPWWKWECYKAGFYNTSSGNSEKARIMYREFLSDLDKFESALIRVITEWPNSCEHFLTNQSMNKIAWLGQASACISLGLPSIFRGGFSMLTLEQQKRANMLAERYFLLWKKEYINTLENGENRGMTLEYQMKFQWS